MTRERTLGSQRTAADLYKGQVRCPWCDATETRLASLFGGTVSELLFECLQCRTPFGVMKWETLDLANRPGVAPDGTGDI